MYKVVAGLVGLPEDVLKHCLTKHLEGKDFCFMAGVSERLNQLFAEKASAAKKAKIEALKSELKKPYSNRESIIEEIIYMGAIAEAKGLIGPLTGAPKSWLLRVLMKNLPKNLWEANLRWIKNQISTIEDDKERVYAIKAFIKNLPDRDDLWAMNMEWIKEQFKGIEAKDTVNVWRYELIHALIDNLPDRDDLWDKNLEWVLVQIDKIPRDCHKSESLKALISKLPKQSWTEMSVNWIEVQIDQIICIESKSKLLKAFIDNLPEESNLWEANLGWIQGQIGKIEIGCYKSEALISLVIKLPDRLWSEMSVNWIKGQIDKIEIGRYKSKSLKALIIELPKELWSVEIVNWIKGQIQDMEQADKAPFKLAFFNEHMPQDFRDKYASSLAINPQGNTTTTTAQGCCTIS